jgi:hypothetical protein
VAPGRRVRGPLNAHTNPRDPIPRPPNYHS